jgi:activating signal cointegrator complex subunit 3
VLVLFFVSKRFLYIPFPVESCLRERLCENVNAEVASGTVNSLVDTVGYLMWTFFARRVRANPSYYGAASAEDSDVESFLFLVAKETLEKLQEHGCITADDEVDDEIFDVRASSLGIAASQNYLEYRTPKQMQLGLRESAQVLLREINNAEDRKSPGQHGSQDLRLHSFQRPERVDEVSIAWLLYTLACTHEFDELPVRHNEEFLNEELSRRLRWGPDTTAVLDSEGTARNMNPDVYADPHSK